MLEILKPGLYTTLQDTGRDLVSHIGVPRSGSMDAISSMYANLMLGNKDNCSVIECTQIGPVIKFHNASLIVITGAIIQPFINDIPVSINEALSINDGDVLKFGRIVKGARFYIAIKGGFQSKEILKSQSTSITAGIASLLQSGNTIQYDKNKKAVDLETVLSRKIGNKIIEVTKGPEWDMIANLSKNDPEQLFNIKYEVLPQSNRMAYKVKHTLDLSHKLEIISSGILPGMVQLTPAGELIILMRDAQTTGGYPRLLQLTEKSICDLAQLKSGDHFSFIMKSL